MMRVLYAWPTLYCKCGSVLLYRTPESREARIFECLNTSCTFSGEELEVQPTVVLAKVVS